MTLPYNGFTKLLDKLLFEESSCLPLWGRWPSAARSEEAEFLGYFRTNRLRRCTFALQKCEPHPPPAGAPSPKGKAFGVLRIAKQQFVGVAVVGSSFCKVPNFALDFTVLK